ncbi:hypothetical protein [Streptomyces sp. NPDC052107]|uniref:hypothetical protein n=1 Tax=Streptomyces sp. NPDC052107 TaxID=3155632 RepID=UPI00342E47D2
MVIDGWALVTTVDSPASPQAVDAGEVFAELKEPLPLTLAVLVTSEVPLHCALP